MSTVYNVSWHSDAVRGFRIMLVLAAFLAALSWQNAAQDQYDRMHDDDDGAACSMHIDWQAAGY